MANWCPRDRTALSDLEVEHEDVDDTLSYIRYPPSTVGSRHDRDRAARDEPRRRRRRRPSRRRALPLARGKDLIVPFVERHVPVIADEAGRPGVRHRRAQGHAGTRSGRLRHRAAARPPESTVIGEDGRMSTEAKELAGLTQDEAGERMVEWARERDLLEKQEPYRHAVGRCYRCKTRIEPLVLLQWWVAMKPLVEPAIAVRPRGTRPLHSRALRARLPRLAREHPPLVHLAPDLVGPPDSRLVLPRRARHGRRGDPGRMRRVRLDRAPPGRGRPRHVVLLGALPVRDPRLAGRRRRPRALLPRRRAHHRARHHLPLGGADDVAGHELLGEEPFRDVVIHSYLANPDGSRMGRTAGTGRRARGVLEPYGADATRYGLLKVTSSQDLASRSALIEEGRKLAIKLWNVSRLILAERRRRVPDARPRDVEERWILARLDAARGDRGLPGAVRLRRRSQAALPAHLRRFLRLVRRGDQAEPLRRG